MSRKSKKTPTPGKPAVSAPKSASAADTESAAPGRSALLSFARTLLVIALGLSAYLAWVSLTRGAAIGCGPESDCDRVLQSKWSQWFGVPVSVFAVAVDALALWGTFALARGATDEARRRGGFACALGALLLLGAGLWFIAIQLFELRSICPYCMAAHGAGMGAGVLLLVVTGRRMELSLRLFQRAGIAAGIGLWVLFVGQRVYQPKTGRETKLVLAGTNLPTVSTQAVLKTNPLPAQPDDAAVAATTNATPTNAPRPTFTPDSGPVSAMRRPFKIYEGLFVVDLENVPIIGSPFAGHAIVSLFDYTCHHCRIMHPVIQEVQRTFPNELAVVSLPMPLDPKCNRTVQRTHPDHTNACEYARLGLAVWRADRGKHHEFDEWLLKGDRPPPVSEALARAVSLVGSNALVRALGDAWVERHLQFNIGIYELAYRQRHGSMPQLIVGSTVSEGVRTREEVFKMLADSLGLKQPQ